MTVAVTCREDVMRVLKEGQKNRAVSATKMNAGSSRSHAVLISSIQRKNTRTGSQKRAKLSEYAPPLM
jgi:kinesin family protein 5